MYNENSTSARQTAVIHVVGAVDEADKARFRCALEVEITMRRSNVFFLETGEAMC